MYNIFLLKKLGKKLGYIFYNRSYFYVILWVHTFALSAIRGELLEREKERKRREKERKRREKERKRREKERMRKRERER